MSGAPGLLFWAFLAERGCLVSWGPSSSWSSALLTRCCRVSAPSPGRAGWGPRRARGQGSSGQAGRGPGVLGLAGGLPGAAAGAWAASRGAGGGAVELVRILAPWSGVGWGCWGVGRGRSSWSCCRSLGRGGLLGHGAAGCSAWASSRARGPPWGPGAGASSGRDRAPGLWGWRGQAGARPILRTWAGGRAAVGRPWAEATGRWGTGGRAGDRWPRRPPLDPSLSGWQKSGLLRDWA